MSARNCPECGGLVASTIDVCPHCGYRFVDSSTYDTAPKSAYRGVNRFNSIGWCIVAMILFWPCGLVSFIYYFKSDQCFNSGDMDGAEYYGSVSLKWAKSTLWLMFALFALVVFFFILAAYLN